ncbi:hypothetical protein BRD00_09675 [Halobacteriales archaeon QS_8_69_26]|nr:MAG: hypothetical protein BRD00_09675 [Halobacteriales archaeon QS_8_69_26]
MGGRDLELRPRELIGVGFLLLYGYYLYGDDGLLPSVTPTHVLIAAVGLAAVYGIAEGSARVLDRVYDSPAPEVGRAECRTCGREVKETAPRCSHCNTREPASSSDGK